MKKIIETSKGRFVVCDKTDNSFLGLICKHEPIKLSEVTEKQASEIVDLFSLQYDKYKKVYKLYNLENIKHTFNPVESLHSLLESQGIETTQNTYIFKVC